MEETYGVQKRQEIVEKVIEYIQTHGYSPTVREIGEMVDLKSTSTVKSHLDKLFREGMLETDHEYCPRAIRVPGYQFVNQEKFDSMYLAKCEEVNELKKQIETLPKAAGLPVQSEEGFAPYCPVCGSGEYMYNEDGNENSYCGQCGTNLNWETTEEGEL